MFPTRASIAVASALCLASAATATVTTANYAGTSGLEGLGSFTAFVSYDYSGGNSAILTVMITNTTSASTGGYVTALAMTAAGASSLAFNSATLGSFSGLSGPVEANPFGTYDAGASTSSSWLGGGSPTSGIGIGSSAQFIFTLSGSAGDLAVQTASTVLLPTESSGLAIRFRGMTNGGSDKVIAYLVPAPGGLALLSLLVAPRARRRRA